MNVKEMFDELKEAIKNKTLTQEELDKKLDTIQTVYGDAVEVGQVALQVNLDAENYFANQLKNIVDAGFKTAISFFELNEAISKVYKEQAMQLLTKNISEYSRVIPKENMEIIKSVYDLFDDIIIVYTDQSGSERKILQETKIERDPIAFGVLKYKNANRVKGVRDEIISDNLIFITDWVDEYSDLTFGKLITEYDISSYKVNNNG